MQLGISLFIACGGEEGLPELRFIDAFGSGIQQEVLRGKEEAGEVFGTLNVACHPVNAVCDSAKHGV
jgi:hypothetical protein